MNLQEEIKVKVSTAKKDVEDMVRNIKFSIGGVIKVLQAATASTNPDGQVEEFPENIRNILQEFAFLQEEIDQSVAILGNNLSTLEEKEEAAITIKESSIKANSLKYELIDAISNTAGVNKDYLNLAAEKMNEALSKASTVIAEEVENAVQEQKKGSENSIYWDKNGDGNPDSIDLDNDSIPDAYIVDANRDGVPERFEYLKKNI
jgi:hypothetical protein